jgi:transforming growth factor-beta-induced protein
MTEEATMKTMRALLIFPLVLGLAACDEEEPTSPEGPTLVEVAQEVNAESGEFSTLLAAVTAAGLVEALSGDAQTTVFAPTDAAFLEIGLDATSVRAVPVTDLTTILLYHVTPGRLAASSVVSTPSLSMANGGTVQVTVQGADAFVNDARIVQTDVEAENGIIHVIDAVLLP